MKLYSFFRSSAAFRVRIALNLKGLDYDYLPIHFRKEGGQHKKPEYLAVNPQGLVPALEDEGENFNQSLAIIEYLDEKHPEPRLVPENIVDRARVRGMAQIIACEIHPLNNLRVLNFLKNEWGHSEEEVHGQWYSKWVHEGFNGLEEMVKRYGGEYCFGDSISLVDVCLVPQVFNAQRFNADLSAYPNLLRITDTLKGMDAFAKAAPGAQPDAE